MYVMDKPTPHSLWFVPTLAPHVPGIGYSNKTPPLNNSPPTKANKGARPHGRMFSPAPKRLLAEAAPTKKTTGGFCDTPSLGGTFPFTTPLFRRRQPRLAAHKWPPVERALVSTSQCHSAGSPLGVPQTVCLPKLATENSKHVATMYIQISKIREIQI